MSGYKTGQSKKVREIKELIEKEGITQDILRYLFSYDPETGLVTRKVFVNSRAKAGDIVGSLSANGYLHVVVGRKIINLHRLAWCYMEGYWPEHHIDHISRDRQDNRWCNLRPISISCNSRNSDATNKDTGIRGVSIVNRKVCSKPRKVKYSKPFYYVVNIAYKGENVTVARTEDFTEAVCHRYAAEQCLNWNNCDANSSAYQYLKANGVLKNDNFM